MNAKVLILSAMVFPCLRVHADVARPEYFMLRPDVEKAYGYRHAVKLGSEVKISDAVSMDGQGRPRGSWLSVKELALPEFMIEIELEAYSPH
jgi:hypothetical protein